MKKMSIIYIIISTFLFSCMEVAIKETNGEFNLIQLNFLRFFIGGLILLPLAIRKLKSSKYHLSTKDFVGFALMGFACVIISMSLYMISIQYIPAYKAAIYMSSNTFFSIILAGIFLKESIPKKEVIALVIALVGMLVIINPFNLGGSPIGVLLCMISSVVFSIYGVFSMFLTKDKPTCGNVMTCFVFIIGSIELLVLMFISHIPAVADRLSALGLKLFSNVPILIGISPSSLPMLLFIAVFITGIGYAAYFLVIETMSVAMASISFFVKPVLAPLFAFILLGEVITKGNLVGILLIVVGSVMLFISNIKSIKSETSEHKVTEKLMNEDIKEKRNELIDYNDSDECNEVSKNILKSNKSDFRYK